jgi:filamentous hemagglutinin family protein
MTTDHRSAPVRLPAPAPLRRLRPLALAAASLFAGSALQAASPVLPSGLQVVQGQATLQTSGRQLTVTNSAGALLNWQQFSIGAGDAVRFVQPSASSKVLNRVVGQDPSQIFGSLSSNGQVWLLNPNGVLFGAGARVDVAGLVASTLRLDDTAWRDGLASGRFSLAGAADGAFGATVVNQGELRSTSGGRVLLLGGSGGVRNEGLIEAPDGQVVLAAGGRVDLIDTALPRLGLQLSAPQGEVLNLGRLSASGGQIDLQAALVNQQGIVRADSLGGGAGGQVLLSASQGATLGAASRTTADGAATGGQVQVDAGAGQLLAGGLVSALGGSGQGGGIALLGRQVGVLDGALVDASGAAGGGTLRVGGGLQGREAGWRNAEASFVGRGAVLRADALVNGDGGLVVLWGDQTTRAYGSFSARGGALGGNGGFIETSGGWIDARPLAVRTDAPAGRAGQWLIDPDDLLISSNASDGGIVGGPDFSTSNGSATLSTFTISQALNANTNVSIRTGDSPGNEGRGDITLDAAFLNVAPTQPVSLTLNATGSILMQGSTIQTLNAPLTVNLVAGALGGQVAYGEGNGNASGGVISISSSSINTAGGDILLGGPSLACGATLGCTAGNTGAVAQGYGPRYDGVAISGSSLRAGSGRIQIDGHSLAGFSDAAGVRISAGSQLEARRIDIHGTVDAEAFEGGTIRYGVVVSDSGLAASERLHIRGSVHTAQGNADEIAATGVDIGRNTLLRTGVADAGLPGDGELPSLLIDGTVGEAGAFDGALLRIGVRIGDNGTKLVALGGASTTINGNVNAPGVNYGIIFGDGSVEIDASAGSALSLNSGNEMYVSGRIRAPSGGSFNLLASGGLYIDAALIDGAPAEVLLRGETVAIGGSGEPTQLLFSGDAQVSVQAGTFVLGSDSLDDEGRAVGAGLAGLGQKQALGIKRALDAGDLPATEALAVLATGGQLQIAADTVLLGGDVLLYAGATDNALRITGSSAGTPVLNFSNLGGAGVLQTPNGHWQLEAADSIGTDGSSFQPGGLRADFWQYGATPGEATPAAPGNGFLFAARPSIGLHAGGEGQVAKPYDGGDGIDLAALDLAVVGLRPGEALAGGLRLQDRNAGEAKAVVPGQGAQGNTVVAADGTPIFGYALEAATLQVNVAPLTLNLSEVQAASKIYDGGTAAAISRWTLSGVLEGDQVGVVGGNASFADANVGNAKAVTATATLLGGLDAGNYRLVNNTATTTADITPATLRYLADPLSLVRGAALPALTGTVQGLVNGETLASATQGQLQFSTEATPQSAAGRYAINGGGLSAQNYVFEQAPGNAVALSINLPPVELPAAQEPVNVLVTQGAVLAVLSTAQGTSATDGRALDALPGLQGDNRSGSFGTLDLDGLPSSTVASVLAARDAYKKTVFRDALNELEANPAAADAAGCATAQQAASGQCLVVRPLGAGLDISNARVVERAPIAVPGTAPPAAATAPAQPAQPAAPAVAAAPVRPPAAPAALRVQPLPADLQVNLPSRRNVARAAVPQIQRKIAVLIGIDRYLDDRIPKLGNAVSDARAVAATLSDKLGYETVVLENAGKATIFRTLNQLAAQVGPADSVVVYYAGHGERVEKTGLGYWQPADADASRPETWISNADIDRLLRQLPAQQLAMVSDSCFSGSLVSGERIRGVAGGPDASGLLGKRAVVVMTSGGNEPVFDSGLNGHSPFAWNLMQSLGQVGTWKAGSSVFEQVRFAVARKLPQRPQYGASSGGGHEAGADYLFEQRELR